jgi:NAD(P)H-hydrate epimerase
MLPVLTAAEMREADRRTIQEAGVPGAVLMENAGAAVARAMRERWPGAARIAVLCGKGNNGGDGFVVARHLLDRRPVVLLIGEREDVAGDAREQLERLLAAGGAVRELADPAAWAALRDEVLAAELVVDALLGTGLRAAPSGVVGDVVRDLASVRGGRGPRIVAVDMPSGLASDGGDVPWPCPVADLTVTFAAPKQGHVLPPASDQVGELLVADIGIPAGLLAGTRLFLLEARDAAEAWPRRAPGSHKGRYGHLLVIAGSQGKSGAAALAATGALRAGVGLVTVATPAPALLAVASARAEAMSEPLAATAAGTIAAEALEPALSLARERDAVALGPGLGRHEATRAFVRAFVRRCPVPLVVDADGLNALAPGAGADAALGTLRREAPTVVTPHPGEAARLLETTTPSLQGRRLEAARALASAAGCVVVLKGQRSVVADPDGRAAVNPTGNPGLATGGTGDVLTGVVGALLARGASAWSAASAAVYLHGLAGDLAARRLGQEGMIAGDVAEALPQAILALGRERG